MEMYLLPVLGINEAIIFEIFRKSILTTEESYSIPSSNHDIFIWLFGGISTQATFSFEIAWIFAEFSRNVPKVLNSLSFHE